MYKYLFTATFSDGFKYIQNFEDKPIYNETGSCFSDILKLIKEGKELVSFCLRDSSLTSHYFVDLTTGIITIDTPTTKVQIPNNSIGAHNYRIIYFRRNQIDFNLGQDIITQNGSTIACFILGWQATDKYGHNIQSTIEIS